METSRHTHSVCVCVVHECTVTVQERISDAIPLKRSAYITYGLDSNIFSALRNSLVN